ncbi:MAG: hypothetical protein GF334_05400 [Candidatus Altiarchaeales archaeon]|nr:hypothetical protein [Candidatus Altiarchaeales archaeon]
MACPFHIGVFLHTAFRDGDELLCRVKAIRRSGGIVVEPVAATWTNDHGAYARECVCSGTHTVWRATMTFDKILMPHDLTEQNRRPKLHPGSTVARCAWCVVYPKDLPVYAGFPHCCERLKDALTDLTFL